MRYREEKDYKGLKRAVVFNCSDGYDNWNQRNSKYTFNKGVAKVDYSWVCNVHAYANALQCGGYTLYSTMYPELERWPDKLAKFCCENNDVDEYFKNHAYQMWQLWDNAKRGKVSAEVWNNEGYAPLNVHKVLCYAVNLFMSGDIAQFYDSYKIVDFMKEITVDNKPIVTSGKFNNLHHIVCVVGAVYDYDKVAGYLDDDDAFVEHVINGKIYPEFIICDDPWGETNNYANSKVGNDAHISWAAFLSDVKPLGNNTVKYAHILRGAMATD